MESILGNCATCKHFTSYETIYEDPLEDAESGECDCPSRYREGAYGIYTTVYDSCGFYTPYNPDISCK